MNTPIALLIFKRPDTTEKVFEVIRQIQPSKLLVVADGPRFDRPGEIEKCAATRAIIDRVDWNCEVLKNYSDSNLGCQHRVVSGLDWVFDTVEEAIILEDDCLPHPSFFRFCEELLDRYRDDERIFAISGQNVQKNWNRNDYSYYFSRYHHGWGWASWRRTWRHFDVKIPLWPLIRDQGLLEDILGDANAIKVWTQVFQSMYEQRRDTIWDYQMMFTCWMQSGLTILPCMKLVENIGFNQDGTHTLSENNPYSRIPLGQVTFPLKHPPFVIRDAKADDFTQRALFDYQPNLLKRVVRKIGKMKIPLS